MPKIQYRTVSLSKDIETYLAKLEVGVGETSAMLGMSESSLKKSNIPCRVTTGGHRRYSLMGVIDIVTKLTEK